MAEFTEEQVVAEVAALRDKLGGVRALARHLGVSPSYVSDVMTGRRAPGPDFLKAVGIRKEVVVRYVREEE
jgi:DNA-binding transcriptional regulator YdaS (Cro superfamily)